MTESTYYYFFSTVAQSLAAAVALLVAFYVATMQLVPNERKYKTDFGGLTLFTLSLFLTTAVSIIGAFLGILLTPMLLASLFLMVYAWLLFALATASVILYFVLIGKAMSVNINNASYDLIKK